MTGTQQINNARLMRWATYASVATALTLILVKVVAWFMTDSVSILATLIDSSLDVLASVVNLVAIHHALQPADDEHRFGHGKAEALAGVGQAMFIIGSAGILLLQATGRLIHPQEITSGLELGIGVMLFSIVLTLALISFQTYVVKQTNSTAIKADSLHYKTDLLVNGSVIIALLLSFNGFAYMDAVFGIGIAVFILYSAWDILKESIDLLMDHELPNEERDKISAIVEANKDTLGFHELKTRRSGTRIFVQLHLELDSTLSLSVAHAITNQIEQKIDALFDDVEVIIHEDPVDVSLIK